MFARDQSVTINSASAVSELIRGLSDLSIHCMDLYNAGLPLNRNLNRSSKQLIEKWISLENFPIYPKLKSQFDKLIKLKG